MRSQASETTADVTDDVVLVLNSGSSSLKFGLYRAGTSQVSPLVTGISESAGDGAVAFHAHNAGSDDEVHETVQLHDGSDILSRIVRLFDEWNAPPPTRIGHRIVHGGPTLRAHCVIDDAVLRRLQSAVPFAPLHMPPALAAVRFARDHFPTLPHVACFDTAFHTSMTSVARTLPLPETLRSEGIERYGFHGLSCESIVRRLAADVPRRLVIAHLGNGSSITAVLDGRSVDNSMGMTPTGGVVMGTRSGDLDPGLIVYLMREKNFDADQIEDLVNHRSGLLALAGGTVSDMRRLQTLAESDARAELAIQIFSYSVAKQIAAMMTALNGADAIVLTGGIGENDARSRSLICLRLAWTGIALDEINNGMGQGFISAKTSRISVSVIASEEDEQIAMHTAMLTRST